MFVQCTTDFRVYDLIPIIDAVCRESEYMATSRFSPTVDWVRALQNPEGTDYRLIVAKVQGRTVGWCRLFPTDSEGEVELGVGVEKSWRNQGIGSMLMKEALSWAQDYDLHIVLYTHPGNTIAHHLFESFRFSLTGRYQGNLEMRRNPNEE